MTKSGNNNAMFVCSGLKIIADSGSVKDSRLHVFEVSKLFVVWSLLKSKKMVQARLKIDMCC